MFDQLGYKKEVQGISCLSEVENQENDPPKSKKDTDLFKSQQTFISKGNVQSHRTNFYHLGLSQARNYNPLM